MPDSVIWLSDSAFGCRCGVEDAPCISLSLIEVPRFPVLLERRSIKRRKIAPYTGEFRITDRVSHKVSLMAHDEENSEKSDMSFVGPRCAECGKPLPRERASYETKRRFYCSGCENIARMKESWQPMIGSSVSAMYVIDSNGKLVPHRR